MHLRIVPIPNIVLIMRTRLSLGLVMVSVVDTSEVDRFSVVPMCHDTDRESFEHRVILLIPLLVSKCLFWIEFTLIIRSAECPNFEIANPIKPALTSRETTLMVSVFGVEVKLKLPNIKILDSLLGYATVFVGTFRRCFPRCNSGVAKPGTCPTNARECLISVVLESTWVTGFRDWMFWK